jgi:hypothetical protein
MSHDQLHAASHAFGGADDLIGISLDPDLLTTGESTMHRRVATSTVVAAATGVFLATFFTAKKTETTTQVRMKTGGTAAAATPTLVRIGLYTVDGAGAGTLVASTVSDTALFAGTFTAYTKSWAVAYAKVAGQRYAHGVITVSGAATPTFIGSAGQGDNTTAPRLHGTLTGQTDLPGSFTDASLGNATNSNSVYAVLLP